jgi:hypothetical protein
MRNSPAVTRAPGGRLLDHFNGKASQFSNALTLTFWGAVVAVAAVYLPSFLLMLAVLPMVERIKRLAWMQAALQGISPWASS